MPEEVPKTLVSCKISFENGEETIKIDLSDGSQFTIKACYLEDYNIDIESWEIEKIITPIEAESLNYASECLKTERAAMRLVARAEQRRMALSAKLERKGFKQSCIKTVVGRFLELNLINDRRFSEIWLRNRISRSGGKIPGPRELKAMLQSRGIDRETAGKAILAVLDEENEWNLLERFIKKRSISGSPSFVRQRLKSEGFSPEILQRFSDLQC